MKSTFKTLISGFLAAVTMMVGGPALALNLCPSAPLGIFLEYDKVGNILIPEVVGSQQTNVLEIRHDISAPEGLISKGLLPPNAQVPACTATPGPCTNGKLKVKVQLDNAQVPLGAGVTVHFLELNTSIPQGLLTQAFDKFPACSANPAGGNAPCQLTLPHEYAAAAAPFLNMFAPHARQYNNANVINIAKITVTDQTTAPGIIQSQPTNPAEWLHFNVFPGQTPADTQWFAFAVLNNGPSTCVQLSGLLPLQHN
jgi:hypothetical protein